MRSDNVEFETFLMQNPTRLGHKKHPPIFLDITYTQLLIMNNQLV